MSATIYLLFCAAPPDMYAFLTAEAYPAALVLFPPIVLDVPNYTAGTNDNKRATVKATHVINKKMRADIVTMNTALTNVFLKALSLQVRTSFLQRRLCKPNIVFVRIAKPTVSKWQSTGIPLTVLTHQSSASSLAQHL